MKSHKLFSWILLVGFVALHFLAFAGDSYAMQDRTEAFKNTTKQLGKDVWDIIKIIGGGIIGGGAIVGVGAGMYRGNWTQAGLSFGVGAAGLLGMWALESVLF